ncbi:MAG: glycosyl transferase family 2 [Bacteroidales bacterium]|jgi:spore coat polysaccharide biosynthesis protein SpsF (cytidylyltransferase family)|nr:glycosyl transferase family 2 [Bacteroidales bacterium]
MKLGIIIQARVGSTRLPNKMILPFYNQMGIFEILLRRLIPIAERIPIIVATTESTKDNIIADIALKNGMKIFRGSEENVLGRFLEASKEYNLEKIIRICADNPFLDIDDLEHQINDFYKRNVDYWCYCKEDLTPSIKTHYGFWSEGVSREALINVFEATHEKKYLEHVTNYIYENSDLFKIYYKSIPKIIENKYYLRLTIDTLKDFNVSKSIYKVLIAENMDISPRNIISLVTSNSLWLTDMYSEIKNNSK